MDTIKEAAIETIKRLPNECSIEDIMYEINFIGCEGHFPYFLRKQFGSNLQNIFLKISCPQ